MDFYKGTFTAATVTGNQTVSGIVDASGNAFTPKGLMIWTTYQTAAGFSDSEGALWQIGFTDGTNQNTAYSRTSDNTSPVACDRTRSATQICLIRNVAGANVRAGTFVSFGSGEFTINWTTADAVAAVFHFIAIGGDGVSCGAFTGTSNNLDSLTPKPTFFADCILFAHCGEANDFWGAGSIGWMAQTGGTITQGSAVVNSRVGQTSTQTARYQRTDRCTSLLQPTFSTLLNDFSWGGLGINQNTVLSSAAIFVHGLAIGGVRAYAGSLTQPTATGTQAITDPGFTPKGLLFASVGNTASTSVETQHRLSLGGADATRQGWAWTGDEHNVNPSVCAGGHSVTACVVAADPDATGASTTVNAEAALDSFDANGFTLDWTTADATQRQVLYLALGEPEQAPSGGGAFAYAFMG